MIELWFSGQKQQAQAVMTGCVNTQTIVELQGRDREILRSSFCKVVYLIPRHNDEWDFENATAVVSRDISTTGLSIVQRKQLEVKRVLIGLPAPHGIQFVRGIVQHTTPLRHNFYHVGIKVDGIENVDEESTEILMQRIEADEVSCEQ